MKLKFIEDGFWVTNITKNGMLIDDLMYNLGPMQSVNLLNIFPIEVLEKSLESGSLFNKSKKLKVVRNYHHYDNKKYIDEYEGPHCRRKRIAKVKDDGVVFTDDDFFISDEKFAAEQIKKTDE